MANFFDQADTPSPAGVGTAAAKPSLFDSALSAEGVTGPAADIARSIYTQESGSGRNTKTSNAGAVGGMQVMPATFNQVADPGWDINNPEHNARAGIRYVKQMYDQAGGDPALTAAGYYSGPSGLEKARQGIAVSDPRNPNAPNTLQYGQQVASRVPAQASSGPNFFDQADAPVAPAAPAPAVNPAAAPAPSGMSMTTDINGNPLPQRTVSFLHGLMDPVAGASQLITHLLPDSVNNAMATATNKIADITGFTPRMPDGGIDQKIRQNEQDYQSARAANGETGVDGYRVLGNILNPANLAVAARIPQAASLAGRVGLGIAYGAGSGATTPVESGDFGSEKIKQVGLSSAFGGAVPIAGGAIARLVSPNASTNANLQLLKSEGVQPTIGQTLGGWVNAAEEKLQSLPIMGDMITRARGIARDQFNNATINRATAPIGVKIEGAGQDAVKSAGDALSTAYDNALSKVQHVPLDPQFHAQLGQLQGMAQNLVPTMAAKFNKTLNDIVLGRVGPQGSMLGSTYKDVDSELGNIASRWGKSQMASEQEYGDAVAQVKNLLKQQMMRTNPQVAAELNAADTGFANLVRVEAAAKAGKNNEGIFTPSQLNTAIQGADDSVRGRAVARGTALMQDLGNAGQTVLGNKYPDSGTAGRAMWGIGALATGALHPAIPAGLIAGGIGYTGPAQSVLRAAVSARPQIAQPAAKTIRDIAPLLAPVGGQIALASDALKK